MSLMLHMQVQGVMSPDVSINAFVRVDTYAAAAAPALVLGGVDPPLLQLVSGVGGVDPPPPLLQLLFGQRSSTPPRVVLAYQGWPGNKFALRHDSHPILK